MATRVFGDGHSEGSSARAQEDSWRRQSQISCGLHQRLRQSQQKQRSENLAIDQFLLASTERPTKFRARWQEKFFDGPAARKDAEEALRTKWLQELESLLKGMGTPMGKVLDITLPPGIHAVVFFFGGG